MANAWLLSSIVKQSNTDVHAVIDARTANLLGMILAAGATLRASTDLWRRRQTTESWRKGSEGEVMTGKALDALPSGFVALHDLRMPGSRANIDHLVIGPTGVFTVETKHYSSDVVVGHRTARHAGRSMDTVVEQANRQAEVVRAVLGTGVRAVVCIQGAAVNIDGLFTKPVVDGVRFCSGRRLVAVLTSLDDEITNTEVERLVVLAERRLQREPRGSEGKPAPSCTCGSRMVLRRRRADGIQFWGCPTFPACRHTLPG